MAPTLAMMERQFRLLSKLVEDLMDVGAFRSANACARHEMVNLRHVVAECIETCGAAADARRHLIECYGTFTVRLPAP